MIKIDNDFSFEQIEENIFKLYRTTYPRYAKRVVLDLSVVSDFPSNRIDSQTIREESKQLDIAEDRYGRDCFVEVMDGVKAEHKILYAVEHNELERLNEMSKQEQEKYFDNLDLCWRKGKGLFAAPKN